MRKKLVVHIGTHKTGTTFIQNTLARNVAKLLKYGILYPKSGMIYDAHFKLNWALRAPKNAKKPLGEVTEWRNLIQEIQNSPADTAVISSEEFSFGFDPARLSALSEVFDVRILCFLRSPDAYLQSFYNQFVKDFGTRETRTLTTYLSEERLTFLNYRKVLEPWVNTFGRDAVTVLNFDHAVKNDSLMADVFAALGAARPVGLSKPNAQILHKVSLPPDILEYLRQCNPYLTEEKGHHRFVVELAELSQHQSAAFQETRSGLLSLKAKQAVRARCASTNVWIAKTFWGEDKNPFPTGGAMAPQPGFDQRPEEADRHVLARVAASIRNHLNAS